MSENLKEEALKYHREGKPGKIEVVPTKPYSTQRDLSMAYTPGVAQPCLEIEKNPECAYDYTAKGNLVAVISNGTAVLGLGDIGALSGKPVMEGKGLLFKIFAGIMIFKLSSVILPIFSRIRASLCILVAAIIILLLFISIRHPVNTGLDSSVEQAKDVFLIKFSSIVFFNVKFI